MVKKIIFVICVALFWTSCASTSLKEGSTKEQEQLSYEYSIDNRVLDTVNCIDSSINHLGDSDLFFLDQINSILEMKYKVISYSTLDSLVNLRRVGLLANIENFYTCFFNDKGICVFIIGDTDNERVIRYRLISNDSLILKKQNEIIKLSNKRNYLNLIRY